MEIQGKKLKFGFKSATKFDEMAKAKNHRTIYAIVMDIAKEQKRLEKKYKRTFDRMTEEQRSEHNLDLHTDETASFVYAGLDMEYDEVLELLEKEIEKTPLFEIASGVLIEFMQSPLMAAMKIKEENPKKPK